MNFRNNPDCTHCNECMCNMAPWDGEFCEINGDPCNFDDSGAQIHYHPNCKDGECRGWMYLMDSVCQCDHCDCAWPFEGEFCETNTDPCFFDDSGLQHVESICKNSGSCTNVGADIYSLFLKFLNC